MARFATDTLAKFAVITAFFVLVAVAPACAMPDCLGMDNDMAADMSCDSYMMVEDSPAGVVAAGAPAPAVVVSLVPAEPLVIEEFVVVDATETGLSPPLSPLGERLSV